MPSAPYVVPPLLLIATLVVSAVAKVRDPRDTSSVFLQLRLPRVLLRLRAPRLLPYGELVLAAFLLLAPNRWYVAAATATLLLLLVYLLVILRAVRLPYPVSCSCFGRLGLGEVTRWTLVRNGVLLALALVTWADSWRGDGVTQRLSDLGSWAWWLTGAGLAAVVAAFVASVQRRTTTAELDPDAYRPAPTPDGVLQGPDGPVPVWHLSDTAARFLVFCDPLRDTTIVGQAAGWAALLRPVRVHVVTEDAPSGGASGDPVSSGQVLIDPGGELRRRLGVTSPGAVLLGTDRMLAGGPVMGADAISELVEAVAAELGVTGRSARQS